MAYGYGAAGKGKAAAASPYSGGPSLENWTCRHCSNENFPSRTVCNTRKCAQPRYAADLVLNEHPEGSWLCTDCGNVNYKSRMQCHTRRCGAPFPGGAALPATPLGAFGAGQRGPTVPLQSTGAPQLDIALGLLAAVASGMQGVTSAAQGSNSADNWTCPACGNVNFASRDVCNTRKCRAPRPAGFGSVPPAAGFGSVPPAAVGAAMRMAAKMAGQQQQTAAVTERAGNWTCPDCGNVNFEHRDVCNTRTCQRPRDGPIAAASSLHIASKLESAKPGSWVCDKCSNVNFPDRMVCNTRVCRAPRPW
eukprot:TRINITY_DN80624_c0_g1_i1.p1 TRINITY_DN80624_c0_g1~~TRINITY_DN80624_c0_g1_i1.p1  ORF type:complete len:306 (+),score=42.09 TRINITY_DN80624_c0_g1_i1:108-1025(+)